MPPAQSPREPAATAAAASTPPTPSHGRREDDHGTQRRSFTQPSFSTEKPHGVSREFGNRVKVVDKPQEAAGGIIVTYRTDPGWISVLSVATPLLIERGSPLTHIAIVARELGIPAVVQIKDLTKVIHTGMRLRVDGGEGTITVIGGAGLLEQNELRSARADDASAPVPSPS